VGLPSTYDATQRSDAPHPTLRRSFLTKDTKTMMEALRNGAKTWVAKVLLGIVMAVFGVLGVSSMNINQTISGLFRQDLATVNGRAISGETYRTNLNRTITSFGQQSGSNITLEQARKIGLDKQVLDELLEQASLESQADALNIQVGDDAAKALVMKEKIFQNADGVFDVDRYRSILQQNGMSEAAYIASTKAEMTRRSITGVAMDNVTIPQTMIDALVRYRDESRDGRYVTFAVTEADVAAPTDAELKKQYDDTPAAYTAPEYRTVAMIKLDPADIAPKLQVTDDELAAGYDRFKLDYYTPEVRDIMQVSFPDAAAAEKAKARVDKGEDLLKIAVELGQKEADILFKDKRAEDFLDEKIAKAAFELAQGAVSAPVVGSLNTALLKAVRVAPAKQPTLAEIKDKLAERVKLEKASEEIQSVYDAVEDARAQQTKFEDIASKVGVPFKLLTFSASGIGKDDKPVGVPSAGELLKAAFGSDVGVENDAIGSEGGGYVWYEVREIIPSAVRPIDQVKEQVKADFFAEKLRTLAADKAKAIVEKAGDTTKLETIATEVNGTIKSATGIKRNNVSEEFDGVATTALFSVAEKALTWALEPDGKSARIIEVSKVTLPAAGATTSAQDIATTAKEGLGSDLLNSYKLAVRGAAKVDMNEELWRQISGGNAVPVQP
jgi:peptidyl-prolyl cis-trans isomerase D